MAGVANLELLLTVTGLGPRLEVPNSFNITTTPTVFNNQRRILATADTAEALGVGDVASNQILVIGAISGILDVDLDFVSSFDTDLTIPEGEWAIIPRPAGTIYVKNNTATETPTYEYYLLGTS